MPTWRPSPIDGISAQRVVLRGWVPDDGMTYFAAAAGDSPFAPGEVLSAGRPLVVPQPAWFHPNVNPAEEPEALPSLKIAVIAETQDVVVIDKPHGMPSTSQGRVMWHCAQSILRRQRGESDLVAVHRLDRLTGGLLLFSRRQTTRAALHTQFERREVPQNL